MNLDDDELGLANATSDRLPFVADVSSGGSQVKVGAELAGVDCDPVRAAGGNNILSPINIFT